MSMLIGALALLAIVALLYWAFPASRLAVELIVGVLEFFIPW